MSMIDHDDQDRLRAQSAALAARRYRRHTDGTIWRVHAQARSPDGPYTLGCPGSCENLLTVTPVELARDFARYDASGTGAAAMPRIPRPEELLPKPVDHTAALRSQAREVELDAPTRTPSERPELPGETREHLLGGLLHRS